MVISKIDNFLLSNYNYPECNQRRFYKSHTVSSNVITVINKATRIHLLKVPAKPDGGEVTPAQLSDNMISAIEEVSYFYWVVSSYKQKKTYGLNIILCINKLLAVKGQILKLHAIWITYFI